MKDNRIVIFGIATVVLIAGVLFISLGGKNNDGEADVPAATGVIMEDGTSEVIQETAVDVAAPATVTAQSEQVVPTPRTGLEATDPGSVNLSSGNVQLVEVFAFW